MNDQDLQRLFDYFDAPSHAFHSIKRYEAVADVLRQWPVLDDANQHVTDVLKSVAVDVPVAGRVR